MPSGAKTSKYFPDHKYATTTLSGACLSVTVLARFADRLSDENIDGLPVSCRRRVAVFKDNACNSDDIVVSSRQLKS